MIALVGWEGGSSRIRFLALLDGSDTVRSAGLQDKRRRTVQSPNGPLVDCNGGIGSRRADTLKAQDARGILSLSEKQPKPC